MQFKSQLISPKGRMEYGSYLSSGNVTKMVNSTVYGGNNTTTDLGNQDNNNGDTPVNEVNWNVFLSKTYNTFNSIDIAAGTAMDTVYVIGYKGTENAATFIGDLDNSSAANNAISGITTGMTVTITNNGQTGTTIQIDVDTTCTETEGSLSIPVYLNISKALNDVGTNWSDWKDNESSTMKSIFNYTWKITSNASDIYNLDLTNENAGVNVDKTGTIYTASTATLACEARLTMGQEIVTSATYSISILPKYNCTGVSINTSTGVLSWNTSTFRFDGNNLPISVMASVDGTVVGTKTMNINKNWPGADGQDGEDGQDAVTKWIVSSANSAKVDKNNTPTPSVITAQVMKQVGGEAPVVTTAETIYYSYDSVNPTTVYPSTGITVLTASTCINLVLRKGNTTAGTIYEQETIPILKDGKDGTDGKDGKDGKDGDTGRAGAAIRGPIKWEDGGNRRWCNGEGPTTADTQWIDICIYNGQYYRCKTSYDGTTSQTWAQVSGNWELAGAEYNFVAAKVILANNAGIDFLTGNEIYLKNNAGQITGGARGSDTANTVNFWAGSSSPTNAPFRVYNDGSILANKGTFAGAVQMPYTHILELSSASTGYIADDRTNIVVNFINSGKSSDYLVLPEPSATYNGVTYHLLIVASPQTKTTFGNPEIYLKTTGSSNKFAVTTYATLYDDVYYLAFYGGNATITCMPLYPNEYRWVLTQCTGGVNIYDTSAFNIKCCLTSIVGYSKYHYFNAITKINTDARSTWGTTHDDDTLYVDRTNP